MRTDLGWSVVITTTTQLVCLTVSRNKPSLSKQQLCNNQDTYLKILNRGKGRTATKSEEVLVIKFQCTQIFGDRKSTLKYTETPASVDYAISES